MFSKAAMSKIFNRRNLVKGVVIGAAAAACAPVFAGGLDAGTEAATDFKTFFFGFLGVVAFIYIMVKGLMAWADKIPWSEFIYACAKVAIVGGTLGLVTYLWSIFA